MQTATKPRQILKTHYEHRAIIPPDDGQPNVFRWHFQRGLLSRRMSGLELAQFVLSHMPSILALGVLDHAPKAKAEFEAMLCLLISSPREAIDRLLPWIRVEFRKEEDDIIHMNLFDTNEQKRGPLNFDMGART